MVTTSGFPAGPSDLPAAIDNLIDDLAQRLRESTAITVFTGAGISTESGVPDFRSKDSPWLRHPPLPYAEFLASEEARREAWRRKFIMDDMYRGARPSRGHRAIVRLKETGRLNHAITQNIDGLHHASGLEAHEVTELHGNGTYAACLSCGSRHDLAPIRTALESEDRLPVCGCGGIVKSATIAFGQSMPVEAMRRAARAASDCDLFLVLGSSLVVQPAATFPVIARQEGAQLIIINREPTPLDGHADLVLRHDIGEALVKATATL